MPELRATGKKAEKKRVAHSSPFTLQHKIAFAVGSGAFGGGRHGNKTQSHRWPAVVEFSPLSEINAKHLGFTIEIVMEISRFLLLRHWC